jgi:SEC-C motif
MTVVSTQAVESTIAAFTKLDQRGDHKAMNKLAARLQKEQPELLQYAAALRTEFGDVTGEAAVFYSTLMWAMFDRALGTETLPRLTQANLTAAEAEVAKAIEATAGYQDLAPAARILALTKASQPNMAAKVQELLEEDVREEAMTAETCTAIVKPTQVVIEAFDAAVAGRRPGIRQGTVVQHTDTGRNETCPCGSGKKYKKCHGTV